MKFKAIFGNEVKTLEADSFKDIQNQVKFLFPISNKQSISVFYRDPFDPDEHLMPLEDQAKFDGMRIRAEEIEEDDLQELVIKAAKPSKKELISPSKHSFQIELDPKYEWGQNASHITISFKIAKGDGTILDGGKLNVIHQSNSLILKNAHNWEFLVRLDLANSIVPSSITNSCFRDRIEVSFEKLIHVKWKALESQANSQGERAAYLCTPFLQSVNTDNSEDKRPKQPMGMQWDDEMESSDFFQPQAPLTSNNTLLDSYMQSTPSAHNKKRNYSYKQYMTLDDSVYRPSNRSSIQEQNAKAVAASQNSMSMQISEALVNTSNYLSQASTTKRVHAQSRNQPALHQRKQDSTVSLKSLLSHCSPQKTKLTEQRKKLMAMTTKHQNQQQSRFTSDKIFNTIEKVKQKPSNQIFSTGLSFGPPKVKKQTMVKNYSSALSQKAKTKLVYQPTYSIEERGPSRDSKSSAGGNLILGSSLGLSAQQYGKFVAEDERGQNVKSALMLTSNASSKQSKSYNKAFCNSSEKKVKKPPKTPKTPMVNQIQNILKELPSQSSKKQKIFTYSNLKRTSTVAKQKSAAPGEDLPEWMWDEARFQAILHEASDKMGWEEEDIEYYIQVLEQMGCETAYKFQQTSQEQLRNWDVPQQLIKFVRVIIKEKNAMISKQKAVQDQSMSTDSVNNSLLSLNYQTFRTTNFDSKRESYSRFTQKTASQQYFQAISSTEAEELNAFDRFIQQQNPEGLSDKTKVGSFTWKELKHQALLSDKTSFKETTWAKMKKEAMSKDFEQSLKFVSEVW